MVTAIIVICCHFYEQSSYTKWIDYWLKRNFIEFNLPPDYVTTSLYENDRSALIFSLFMVKYAMLLIVGIKQVVSGSGRIKQLVRGEDFLNVFLIVLISYNLNIRMKQPFNNKNNK